MLWIVYSQKDRLVIDIVYHKSIIDYILIATTIYHPPYIGTRYCWKTSAAIAVITLCTTMLESLWICHGEVE